MNKRVAMIITFAAVGFLGSLQAEQYKGRWEAGVKAGGAVFEGNSFLNEDPVYGGQVGYNVTEHLGLEASVLWSKPEIQVRSNNNVPINAKTPDSHAELLIPSLDVLYHFGQSRFRPFVSVGVSDFHLNPDTEAGVYGLKESKRDDLLVQYGVGLKWLFTQHLLARLDLKHLINTEFNYSRFGVPENIGAMTAGVSWLFGGKTSEAKPQKLVEAKKEIDSDGDGVIDDRDACPGTPSGTKVDAQGCAVLTDADADGIADDKDECPGTPAGTKVDTTGCPQTVKAIEDTWVLKGVNFETSSDKIKTESLQVLDDAAEILKARTKVRVEIQGHTDSLGKPEANLVLSDRRATSVKNYLVGKGVNAEQLTTKGYGETQPVADNKTPAGRSQNRRIEFKVLSR